MGLQRLMQDFRIGIAGPVLLAACLPGDGHPWLWTLGRTLGHGS